MSVFYEVPHRIILKEADVQLVGEDCAYFSMSKAGVKHVVYEIASSLTYQDLHTPLELTEEFLCLPGNHVTMTLQAGDAKWMYVTCPGLPENSLLRLKRSKVWGTFFDFKTTTADAYVAYPMDAFRLVSARLDTAQLTRQADDYDTGTISLLPQKEWENANNKRCIIGQPDSKVVIASLQQIRPYSKVKVRFGSKWVLGVTMPTIHTVNTIGFTEHPDSTLVNSFLGEEYAISTLFIQSGNQMLVPDDVFTSTTNLMYLQGLPEPLTEQELVFYGASILAYAKSLDTPESSRLRAHLDAAMSAAGFVVQESYRVPLKTYLEDPTALHNQPQLLKAYLDHCPLYLPIVQPDFCNYGIMLKLQKLKNGSYSIQNHANNVILGKTTAVENLAPMIANIMGVGTPEHIKGTTIICAEDVDPYGHSKAQWGIQNFSIKTFELRSLSNAKYQANIPLCQLTLS